MHAARLLLVALTLLSTGLVGCGSDDTGTDPTGVFVRFEPEPGDLEVVAYVLVEFRAFDESSQAVRARFYLDDELIDEGSVLQWKGETLGDNVLVAEVEHRGKTFRAEWRIHVTDVGAQNPPPVVVFAADEGETPGSVAAWWDKPSGSLHPTPILEYELAYAVAPIADDAAFAAAPKVLVTNNPDVITQRATIEGLAERQRYHLRIRARDRLNLESVLSVEVSSEATGHFDVTGIVYEIDRSPLPPRPLSRVLIDLEGVKAFTGAAGTFELTNVPDLRARTLTAVEDQFTNYYAIVSAPLPPTSRELTFLLFPRDVIRISGTQETFVPLLNFLRTMTVTASDFTLFTHWEQYPILLYAHEHVVQSTTGEFVDYRQAMITAASRWNEQAGEELVRIVDTMPAVGAYYTTDLVVTDGLHGQVVLERPGGQLFEAVPELARIRLRDGLPNQATADRIVGHEMGHLLLLAHSQSNEHLMNISAPASTGGVPHRDEAYVARLLSHMPNRMDASWYSEPPARR